MRFTRTALALAMVGLAATPARAGVYGDELAKCLVARTTDADKTSIMQWLFAAMSAHPAVAGMANVSAAQRSAATRQFAKLVQELLTARCRAETVAALKYEGTSTMESSFNVLGQIAMRGLMSDPSVASQLAEIGGFMDEKALKELSREAGLTPK